LIWPRRLYQTRAGALARRSSASCALADDSGGAKTLPPPTQPPAQDQAGLDSSLADPLESLEEQLQDLRAQLTESQRLAAIGTIAAEIAHEFNNLLTPLGGYAQLALRSAQSDKPDMEMIAKALGRCVQSAEKAGRICTSMLKLARGEESFERVDVQRLIDEVLNVLARDPRKDGIALRVQVAPGLAVWGDPIQLEQVLLNLLINARQAMLGKGGSITVRACAADGGDQVRIHVIDTGPGIAPKHLSRIFEPFFTTKGTARKGEARGTGLGLAICRDIIQHHRGSIEVQSVVGKGTTFVLGLPVAPTPQADRAVAGRG
jgi:signal transduction histidine kinase